MEVLQNNAGPSPDFAGLRLTFKSLRRAAPSDAHRRGACGYGCGYLAQAVV